VVIQLFYQLREQLTQAVVVAVETSIQRRAMVNLVGLELLL
jgi:hypothetical protein